MKTMILFLAAALAATALLPAAEGPAFRLIAHRGGVVDGKRPENSTGAMEEAIRRGYWMLEIDLQETRDGKIVVHHDSFRESFGDPRWPREMTWEEIRNLRASEDGSRPLDFAEFAARCKGRTQLMMDIKGPSHPPGFYEEIERIMRENGLLEEALFIGTQEARNWFKGKARISVESKKMLQAAVAAGENVSRDYFLFEHADTLDEASLAMAKRLGVPAVVSINVFHYRGQDHMKAAKADIERLKAAGLVWFQIDSVYDSWLR